MTKSKKLSMFVFSLLLVVASLLFVACGGKDYSNVTLTASQEEIVMFANDENAQNVTFTINNPVRDMASSLTYTLSNPSICTVSVLSTQSYSTTYAITGVKGGVSDMTVRTNEGNVSHTIRIQVRQFSSNISPADNSLYLSLSSEFYPSAADFTFSDNATERDLDFYFYGKVNDSSSLTIGDITQNEEYVNAFVQANLIEMNDSQYIIFTDENGLLYTLGRGVTNNRTQNTFYSFINVNLTDGEYVFDTAVATKVQAGDKFTFFAVNQVDGGEVIYCQRDFYVLIDINYESISHEYGYRIVEHDYTAGSDYLYKLEDASQGEITLVPSYQNTIPDGIFIGNTVDFITIYLGVTIASENDLMQVRSYVDDANVINVKRIESLSSNGQTTYYFQIDCATGVEDLTNLNINFYYEGFENSEDENVNFVYSIPVNIRVIPTNLLINNIDFTTSEIVYTFYNSYAGNSFGWQEFLFSVNPEDAEYDELIIDLTDTDLQLRYNNTIYQDQAVIIYDLSQPVYIKGVTDAAITSGRQTIPVSLNFNVIQEGSLKLSLQYEIVQGATFVEFQTEEFSDRIYLDLNAQEPVEFLDLYADAQFSSITVSNLSGSSVARFIIDEQNPYKQEGSKYLLNLHIKALATGTGTYSIVLDNGVQTTLTITVQESLGDISISTQNQQNSIKYIEDVKETERNSTLLYVFNAADETTFFDIEVVANDNVSSTAITNIQFNFTSQLIQLNDVTNNNKNFNVYLRANGSSELQLTIGGYSITDFRLEAITKTYYLDIVAFNYIGNLNVFKESDGEGNYLDPSSTNENIRNYGVNAAYADVYSGTSLTSAREAVFNITVNNKDAYLFANPSYLNADTRTMYVENTFDQSYVYWETDSDLGIQKNGEAVNIMYQSTEESNVYTIVGLGTFDTETLTFTAFSNIQNPRTFKLIAHVRQYGRVYSYTINIRISVYEEVSRITLQDSITSIEFTSTERQFSLIAYPTNLTATNGEIVALFEGGDITIQRDDGSTATYYMLDEDSIEYIESDGRYQITLTVNDEFVKYAEDYQDAMEGTLYIAARDWLDDNNNILSDYQDLAIEIEVRFANGTEQNRFTLNSAQDLVNMNLSAHYQISTTIDVSSISDKLPLGQLQGSIVGTSEYAEITGINIINSSSINNIEYYGIFTSIGTNAYIEYVKFTGEFNIGSTENEDAFASGGSYIGLVAGENNGTLINIGVTIASSNINVKSGYVGGVVGCNNGTIIQDYTLFEDNSSNTRTYSEEQLKNVEGNYNIVGSGRYSLAGLTPNILVYMEGTVTVSYVSTQDVNILTYVGGVAGQNNGTIEKIDSKVLAFTGYTNYMAYTQISLVPISFNGYTTFTNQTYVGGLAGTSGNSSTIIGGYNNYQNDTLTFMRYRHYEGANETATDNDYIAGQGIVVGGQVSGYDYVGGVVGYIDAIGDGGIAQDNFTGITSRTFVRGLLSSVATPTPASVAAIANIKNVNNMNSAFAMQAVDVGNTGINSSMIVLHNTTVINSYFRETNIANSNKLAFGNSSGNTVAIMNGTEGEEQENIKYTNVNTFVMSRSRIEMADSNITINNLIRTSYYGDFVIVGDNGNTLLAQSFFTEGGDIFLSLNAGFNNKLTPEGYENHQSVGNKEIYYMFYFAVSSAGGDGSQDYQELLDTYMNNVSFNSTLYPFTTNGEMTFTSNTRDILTIDQNGRITVKGTGIANITATSILNTNNAIEFYIYVVNYFNPDAQGFTEEVEDTSIIYPNGSSSSLPIGDTTINLRGQNSASLYVRPHYTLNIQLNSTSDNTRINVDALGVATLNNVVFNLATNTIVTAQVTSVQRASDVIDDETGGMSTQYVDAKDELDIEVAGQTITLRRNELTQEADYKLAITPIVEFTFSETDNQTGEQFNVTYVSGVNRELDNVTVNYRKGASSINNTKYNEVTLLSSRKFEDVIIIDSTAVENTPLYYIVRDDNINIQGSESLKGQGFNFLYDLDTAATYGSEFLFDVSFVSDINNSLNLSSQRFNLTISLNKNSQAYINRYVENIYGQYTIYILAESNTAIYKAITINLEQTNISSVVIDNYSSLAESTGTVGISSTSNYAYPGTTGLLAITISPDDSDFDYILIENAPENYNNGNASANFGFLARKANTTGTNNIFDDKSIVGSATSTGLRVDLNDIISTYNQTENVDDETQNIYYTYNGVVYISYDLTSVNVNDESTTSIKITLMKDGEAAYTVTKNLTVRLQNYVSVEIENKTPAYTNENGYYASYNVARGMRYHLLINSYGYLSSNISAPTLSNDTFATIVEEDGEYYLEISSNTISYDNNANAFNISISATQIDGDNVRSSSSTTHVVIQEYVVEYNGESVGNSEDIISGMGNGEINVQVGTQTTFSVDIFSHIEYDLTNVEVVSSVNEFMANLAHNGIWKVTTNLINDELPDYSQADDEGKLYYLGYDAAGGILSGSNYYFNYTGLNLTPVRTHDPDDRFYYITFYSDFSYSSSTGTYTASRPKENNSVVSIGSQTVHTEFVLNVYSSSSEESPIPIYDYNDFLDMQSGGYYILLNDLTLPNRANESQGIEAFTPQEATFKSFDGNGHTINFAGTYDLGSATRIGLFTSLPEGSIIRNLNVNFTAATDGSDVNVDPNDDYGWYGLRTVKFITTTDTFNYGTIVAENQGTITNCRVSSDNVSGSEYYVVVKADNALNGLSYMGGITATNSGYITNCTVSVNMRTPYNMGGIVGQNSGKIAACYFKDSVLVNNSQQNQHIAGFAVTNTEAGQIITSYVSGQQSNTSLYSKDSESYIASTIAAAGFVYQNAGYISDCYTDIDLSQTTSDMAGFAYMNGGEIRNSFSLSVLRNNVTASAGFARYNSYDNSTGTFENCYYFYNEEQISSAGSSTDNENQGGNTSSVNEDGFITGEKDINTSVIPITYDGIERLNAGGFANISENFENYSYHNSMGTNAVWFYSSGNTSTTYVDYIPTTETVDIEGEDGNVQTNTMYRTELMTFGLNRLELVSPNVIALSIRNFSYSELDANTGEVIYHYIDDSNTPNRGSIHNPRLIYDAQTMESEISEQTSGSNINISNYRIISDIDYSEYEDLSVLYKTTFAGNLEGNGMEISQISLVAMDNLTSAGLFAQIGYSANNTGVVKNLTITPTQVAFANSNSVGTLAGTLRYGYIYDVTIDGRLGATGSTNGAVVIGRNFVGGVVGRAISSYSIKNISSNINTSSTYTSALDSIYTETQNNLTSFSYSGSIAGFVGTGSAYNLEVSGVSSIQGSRVGFAFGGIGNSATISRVFVDVAQSSIIRAYHYGGYVAGETSGKLSYAHVSSNGNMESTFSVVPRAASAVGGITGVLSGGTISNAVMEQSFRATAVSNSSNTINNVGGIAGIITNAGNRPSYIEYSIVNADLEGASILGGTVGSIENVLFMDNIAVKSTSLSVTGQTANPYLGGVVGLLSGENNASLTMTNSYCTSLLTVNTSTSGSESAAAVGGLVGGTENSRVPFLAYCYTTSTIDATVVDNRSIDAVSTYSAMFDEEGKKTNDKALFNYAINNDTSKGNFSHVYYLGHNSSTTTINGNDENSLSAYNACESYGITYRTKVLNATIGLTINNYGTSSLEYAQNFALTSPTVLTGTTADIFYNLYSDIYSTTRSLFTYSNTSSNSSYSLAGETYEYEDGVYIFKKTLEDNKTITADNIEKDYNGVLKVIYITASDDRYIYGTYNDRTGFWKEGFTSPTDKYEQTIEATSIEKIIIDFDKADKLIYDHMSNSYSLAGDIYTYNENNGIYSCTTTFDGGTTLEYGEADYGVLDIAYITASGTKYTYGTYNDKTGFFRLNAEGEVDKDEQVQTSLTVVSIEKVLLVEKIIANTVLVNSAGTNFEQMTVRAGTGNSLALAYRNILTNTIYYQTERGFETASGATLTDIPTIPVWNTSRTGVSTLAFESELDWLNR